MVAETMSSPEMEAALQKPTELLSTLLLPEQVVFTSAEKIHELSLATHKDFELITHKKQEDYLSWLENHGFDQQYLKQEGRRIQDAYPESDPTEMKKYMQQTISYNEQGQVIQHSDLTVGLKAEMCRQARKLLKAVLANNPDVIFQSDDVKLSPEEIQQFIEKRNSNTDQVHALTKKAISRIEDSRKQGQYTLSRSLLFKISSLSS